MQQGLHIEALEGTIKALENASSKYIEENAELRHEINKLKEQLKDEQKSHEATKVTLKEKSDKLTRETEVYTHLKETIDNQKTWKGSLQPVKDKIIDYANKTVDKVTSWFKRRWF
ncbi:MAG: chromosome segregation ATPase [Candidatus Phytoplasma asteris]|uniref:Chromosome segregation ATPase homolog n=2 Tax=16SrI (Aster yellows group) TaxID=3042590 RepID=Q6YQ59_ONYPE|nr:chromosome segregation ATPase ['Chrysanthemum coronarium' phytoplasma]TKA88143.1 MAG: chromosome segregation ATPase [Periwinkle leaf yellowing phytoplasma]WEX19401.1 MAG: chromosome segregation ATPase [Candidatus Phytoplasma asteris]BAD04601.1 chromosome segregation ATPase homolog [Onion yellows phytoplasma OY-M]GAK74047.1 chromosome segregation ATPase ['Chrysanthemum coronarium' phytoplasma]